MEVWHVFPILFWMLILPPPPFIFQLCYKLPWRSKASSFIPKMWQLYLLCISVHFGVFVDGQKQTLKKKKHKEHMAGRDLRKPSSPTPLSPPSPLQGRTLFLNHAKQMFGSLSAGCFEVREGDSLTSLGNRFRCLATLTITNFFLISNLYLPFCKCTYYYCGACFLWIQSSQLPSTS